MSDCTKCFRYRSKEREIDALRHELGLLEAENKGLRNTLAEFINDDCVLTARADNQQVAAAGYYPGGGGAGIAGGGHAWQQALGQANQVAQQNTMAQQQAMMQQNQIMAAQQQALAQQAAGPLTAVQAAAMQQRSMQQMPPHQNLGQNGGVMGYTMGCGGAGGAGGNGGNGVMAGVGSRSARAWCEKHQRWADECGVRSVGAASKSVIAAIKKAMGMDVTA